MGRIFENNRIAVARIERRHGMEFRQVLAVYAGQGLDKKSTAAALGWSTCRFYRFLERHPEYNPGNWVRPVYAPKESPKGRLKRQTIERMARVEAEHGETFTKVLQGYADMGYSRRTTAGALGWNERAFYKFLTRHPEFDVEWPEPKNMSSTWPTGRRQGRKAA
jgi:hypothetical protein